MIRVEYSSNNSGGDWWLEDEDWKALEDAGWLVLWKTMELVFDENGKLIYDDNNLPKTKSAKAFTLDSDERWLGALATKAFKVSPDIMTALREFEGITGQDVSHNGCGCCGSPHYFEWRDLETGQMFSGSGEDLLEYMYPGKDTKMSKREMLERS